MLTMAQEDLECPVNFSLLTVENQPVSFHEDGETHVLSKAAADDILASNNKACPTCRHESDQTYPAHQTAQAVTASVNQLVFQIINHGNEFTANIQHHLKLLIHDTDLNALSRAIAAYAAVHDVQDDILQTLTSQLMKADVTKLLEIHQFIQQQFINHLVLASQLTAKDLPRIALNEAVETALMLKQCQADFVLSYNQQIAAVCREVDSIKSLNGLTISRLPITQAEKEKHPAEQAASSSSHATNRAIQHERDRHSVREQQAADGRLSVLRPRVRRSEIKVNDISGLLSRLGL